MSDDVTPFRLAVPDAELDDLRRPPARTRWPEAETVDDWSQGIPLAYVQELCEYWADGYDWRAAEARLNALPAVPHRRSTGSASTSCTCARRTPDALPLVITHGWPGSVVEFLEVIGPLTDPPPTAATRPTRSTSSARRCPATASATSRPRPAGASSGSPTRGPS